MDWFAVTSYRGEGGPRPALVLDPATVVDLATARQRLGVPGEELAVTASEALFERWEAVEGPLRELAERARKLPELVAELPSVAGRVTAPFRPRRIFAAASNYVEHADEMGTVLAAKAGSDPFMFMKADTCVVGRGDPVHLPASSRQVDWEVELAAVIGRAARHVPAEDALAHVAGYTVVNDVSARDLNVRGDHPFKFDWFQGKNHDTFAPFGPWVVPAILIADPQALELRLAVNGEVMQQAKTSDMIFTVAEQVAYLSGILTLRPGDVVATGTPDGVGMGRGVFLRPGDHMRAEVEHIGVLDNPVVAEPSPTAESGAPTGRAPSRGGSR